MVTKDLFHAIYEEHKARTNHDIYSEDRFSTLSINCNVCLYLKKMKDDDDLAEMERQTLLPPPPPPPIPERPENPNEIIKDPDMSWQEALMSPRWLYILLFVLLIWEFAR